jgi:hypothetical protein
MLRVREYLPKPALLLLFMSIPGGVVCQTNPPAQADLPAMSKLWSDAEKTEFQGCVSRLTASRKERDEKPKVDAGICEVWEERQHWLRAHPDVSEAKEDQKKFRSCNHAHSAQVNGTPEQARAALDLCWCRAYGLPDPPDTPR